MSDGTCADPECPKPALTRGMCNQHYRQWLRAVKSGQIDKPVKPTTCSITGCSKAGPLRRTWCDKHYQMFRTYGDPTARVLRERTGVRSCARCGRTPDQVEFRRDKRVKDGLGAYCLPCGRDYNAEISDARRAAYRATERRKYAEHPEPRRAKNRLWLEANREAVRERHRLKQRFYPCYAKRGEYKRRWAQRNPDYWVNWYAANRSVRRQRAADWRAKNKDRIAAYSAQRRARKQGGRLRAELVERRAIWSRDGGICQLCALPVAFDEMHMDHVIPLIRGGPHTFDNLQTTHPRCNLRKNRRILPRFAFARRSTLVAQ